MKGYVLLNKNISSFIVPLGILFILCIGCDNNNNQKNEFDFQSAVPIDLPYTFKNKSTEKLSIKAFNLRKEKKFLEAIKVYNEAINIESHNPKLFFDLSECYADIDKPKEALLALDNAIKLDSLNAYFYNNKGLIYYRSYQDQNAIREYKKAIRLDSLNYVIHANLSLAYYSLNNIQAACKEFMTAKQLGLKLNEIINQPEMEKLKRMCEIQ